MTNNSEKSRHPKNPQTHIEGVEAAKRFAAARLQITFSADSAFIAEEDFNPAIEGAIQAYLNATPTDNEARLRAALEEFVTSWECSDGGASGVENLAVVYKLAKQVLNHKPTKPHGDI